MSYKLLSTGGVLRVEDNTFIPEDPLNVDWRLFGQWKAEGNTPLPADMVVPEVPQTVSRFQARAALHLHGHLAQVEEYMALPETDPMTKLAWTDAQEFRRTSPTVIGVGQLLGLTPAILDNLFIEAAKLEA